ncbi:hypothetical protein SEA_FLAGSTAFF_44 [Mycobacterium phage FlagStaff]|uniref:Uncharacterized protein n=1 Tax=Mycobacterium phage FlagStaff TaxID=1647304 RepID=A0A0F6WE97_9CAUD|nr:hypothetical protein AVT49_gp44 [Mycobacterium phage FlagStaff]AKF14481.1 hypothetical protein SEA_FLAGSTAFF_44 [Mycobacterium phage FlagStaff]
MGLIQDQPEGLPSGNDLDNVEDPDAPPPADPTERAEIFLSGAHVATLDSAPRGLGRVTLMVELEVTEEATRFTEDGTEVPIRRCRRIGDMWIPGTPKPPTREEIKAEQLAAKARAAAEQAERDEAERAEAEKNEPPMFDDEGNPIADDAPRPPADDDEDQGDDADPPAADPPDDDGTVVQFSDAKAGK